MKLRVLSRTMPRRGWLLAALLLAGLDAGAQHRPTYPHPPEPADPRAAASAPQTDPSTKMRVSPAQLRQEAQELSSLAQAITQDIDAVNRGVLPKDMVSRLKRVEKLAKQLRQEIGRYGQKQPERSSEAERSPRAKKKPPVLTLAAGIGRPNPRN